MRSRPGTAIVAHSGGPTSVINSSLYGLIAEARRHSEIEALYGARYGFAGILANDFVDLLRQPREVLEAIAKAPGSALGSSRYEVRTEHLQQVLRIFDQYKVRFFFYTGGNGSMGTAQQLHAAAREIGYDLQVVGIPKTIDNDLLETDHTPGYASAANFFACAVRDIGIDNASLPNQVEIIEVLGRNAGWIVGATAFARHHEDEAPHLIYFPENALPLDTFLSDVERVYAKHKRCVVAVCEGQLDENGSPFGADTRSGSRGSLASNLGHRLAMLVTSKLGLRARSEKPGLLGRASSAFVVETDRRESELCGRAALISAVEGRGGTMVTLVRDPSAEYDVSTGLTSLDAVAFKERLMPASFRNKYDNWVTAEFLRYAEPLIGRVAAHQRLETIK